MSDAPTTVFICVSCKEENTTPEIRPGRLLYDRLTAALAEDADSAIEVRPVECLAVCKRPCTIALTGEGKWTYVIGSLDPASSVADILSAARSFGDSATGIVPWRERPVSFRKGVVSRVPPLSAGNDRPA